MRKEDEESKVYNDYASAMDYLTVQSHRVDSICNNLNLLSGVTYVPAHATYPQLRNTETEHFLNKEIWDTSVPSSFIVNEESLGYAEVKATVGALNQPNLISAVGSVQSHLNQFNSIQSFLPNIEHSTSIMPSVGFAREATSILASLSEASTIGHLANSIEDNISPWYRENIASSAYLSSPQLGVDINETSKYIGSIIGSHSLSSFAVQSSIVKASEYSFFAEKSIYPITADNIGSRINLANDSKNYLASSFAEFSQGYASFIKSYEYNPLVYTQFNPSISKMVPSEYFLGANLLESISVDEEITVEEEELKAEIQYENEILLRSYLPKINPGLFKMWKGAIEAYHSDNSDKVRHFSASLRELFTHVLHQLAPDKAIKKWTSDPSLFHQGKPTRKARLLYICRNINSDTFNTFVDKNIDTTISFIDIFQKGTHEIEPAFNHNQLVTIKSKAESTLKFLLEIHFKTNN